MDYGRVDSGRVDSGRVDSGRVDSGRVPDLFPRGNLVNIAYQYEVKEQ